MKIKEWKKIENAFYSYKNYINQGVKSIIDWAESGITANYQKLDEEIRKTNEFLMTLKELQQRLDR